MQPHLEAPRTEPTPHDDSLDAEFFDWQKTDGLPLALFTVVREGHPLFKSTVSAKTLTENGLSFRPPPGHLGMLAAGFPKRRNNSEEPR